MTKNVLSMK